jgi:hypothetical protein
MPLHPVAAGTSAGRSTDTIPSSMCGGSAAVSTALATTASGWRSAASAYGGVRRGKAGWKGARQSEQLRQGPGHLRASTAAASWRPTAARPATRVPVVVESRQREVGEEDGAAAGVRCGGQEPPEQRVVATGHP